MWHCFRYGPDPIDFITDDVIDILAFVSDCINFDDLFEIRLIDGSSI